MKAKTRWTDAENARLRTLYAQGMSVQKIGAELGRSTQSIKDRAVDLGLSRRPSPVPTALIMEMAQNGVRAQAIADATHATVGNKLTRMAVAGQLFRATLSHKNVVFFATPEAARAYEDANRKPTLTIKHRAPWPADAPMNITKDTVFTKCPSPPERVLRTNTFLAYA